MSHLKQIKDQAQFTNRYAQGTPISLKDAIRRIVPADQVDEAAATIQERLAQDFQQAMFRSDNEEQEKALHELWIRLKFVLQSAA